MKNKIKIGYIGLGKRGMGVLKSCFSEMEDVEISVICDVSEEKLDEAKKLLEEKGRTAPRTTLSYQDVTSSPELDAVVIMTGWNAHIKPAIASLRAGKYTAIEVGCAYSISECYELLAAHESTGAPLMMLENCCYGRRELMTLKLAAEGKFGEIVHCTGGYAHYLTDKDLFIRQEDGSITESLYRLDEYVYRNADQYPTHQLGPISKVLGINRGNRMLTLTSHGSKARGLSAFAKDNLPTDHPYSGRVFNQSDIIDTHITCQGGETIHLTLDTTLPRPYYSRNYSVRGTHGACIESAKNVCTYYFTDTDKDEVFNNEEETFEKYDHPLYKEYLSSEQHGGHGGMDWLCSRAFVESVKAETDTPIDVYDTLLWLSIGVLSEQSLAKGGVTVTIPDFTNGKWLMRETSKRTKYSLDLEHQLEEK